MPITTLSVAWVLANPAITLVILGASRIEQLTDTLAARGLQTRQRIENEARRSQLNAGPMFFGGDPTGYALNITTEERKFMSITSLLRERNQ